MPTALSRNLIGSFTQALSQFRKYPNLVALTAYLRVFPREETFGDKLVHGVANLGLRLKNNLFNRGEPFGQFQMIRQEAFTRLGGFRVDLVTMEDADMFRRLSKIGKTMINPELTVLHTGRRAHQVGWPRLIVMWLANSLFVSVYNRSSTREWKAIRGFPIWASSDDRRTATSGSPCLCFQLRGVSDEIATGRANPPGL